MENQVIENKANELFPPRISKRYSYGSTFEYDVSAVPKQAFIKGAEWMREQCNKEYAEERIDLLTLVNMLTITENNHSIIEDLKGILNITH